ncbi:transposase [Microcoleus sp. FACHB-68]|uniref:transposase n=1 Tax=Microcoleus sp. FACHB-68 TaxID=2692826 RepID=UPI001683F89F|nr:transposase [Microcoleus sp. FACHB-68]MBD1938527.1 transposase [Microcoleus sp. FACHB-68]
MNYNPEKHHRHSIRLKGYDYRQGGAYYVTICCHQRRFLLGEIVSGVMHSNHIGATVQAVWDSLPHHFPFLELDAFVVMPNHIHGILVIVENYSEASVPEDNDTPLIFSQRKISPKPAEQTIPPRGTLAGSLGAIIQNFKSVTTRRVNRLTGNKATIWQRNYYEKIIQNKTAYQNIRRYIMENPLNWNEDEHNPSNKINK